MALGVQCQDFQPLLMPLIKGKEVALAINVLFLFWSLGQNPWHMEVPRLGVQSELQLLPTPQPQQRRIQDLCETYTTVHGNTRYPTH